MLKRILFDHAVSLGLPLMFYTHASVNIQVYVQFDIFLLDKLLYCSWITCELWKEESPNRYVLEGKAWNLSSEDKTGCKGLLQSKNDAEIFLTLKVSALKVRVPQEVDPGPVHQSDQTEPVPRPEVRKRWKSSFCLKKKNFSSCLFSVKLQNEWAQWSFDKNQKVCWPTWSRWRR